MAVRLCVTGMEQSTANRLRAALEDANRAIGQVWELVPDEATATHVIVDMDSVYGPMSWIRLHGAGKRVVGMTSSSRTNADFYLQRDFDPPTIEALLRLMAVEAGETIAHAELPPTNPPQAETVELDPGEPSGMTSAPSPVDRLPEEILHDATHRTAAPPLRTPQPTLFPSAPSLPDPTLADWFRPGVLGGRFGYKYDDSPMLLIDVDRGVYHGPSKLKPLAAPMRAIVRANELKALDAAAWQEAAAQAGPAQPLDRLKWYGALLAGKGQLLSGKSPDGLYRLTKWTQTEREFPKHFRIATAMMRGPSTIADIADAAQVPREDVIDFLNANLAVGHAEWVPAGPSPGTEPAKPSGLFGRLRGR